MATIKKIKNSYKVTVSCGYSTDGRQIRKSSTFTPREGMSEKQIKKELDKFVYEFEAKCHMGACVSGNVKFSVLADRWLEEQAKPKLKERTYHRYFQLRDRVYKEIGHIRVDQLNTFQIQSFINSLEKAGTNQAHRDQGLSPKTIRHYHTFISDVMSFAIESGMISDNPCRNVVLPKLCRKEKEIYSLEELEEFLNLLNELDGDEMKYKIFFMLAVYGGMRKGEILGLEWKDIDFDYCTIDIMRSSLYTPKTKTGSGQMTNQGKGTYTDTPKTKGSVRTLKLPDFIFDMLREYKQWQDGQRTALGDQWQDYDRLFTCYNGAPMSPSTPSNWLTRFQAKNGLRRVTTHSFRHLNASILIYENLDAKTVSACLGHSNVTTTLDIYTHEFNRAKARSSEALTKAIDFNPKKKK